MKLLKKCLMITALIILAASNTMAGPLKIAYSD
jgi:hypothetical protein